MKVPGKLLLGCLAALFFGMIAAPTSAAEAETRPEQAAFTPVDTLASVSPQDETAIGWCYDPYWGWYPCSYSY